MEWRALLQRLDFSGKLGKTEALELLRALRKTNLRRPDVVLQLGPVVEASVSEAERMLLYEQMFLAALDMKLEDKAEQYLAHLASAFPDSSRVLKLQGMQQEARGNYDMAMAVYDKLLLENPANISVLQRTAATYKAQGNLVEALSELNKILELSSADASVWSEVAEIHIRLSNYAEAAFCLEEMVLIDPSNHVTCTKLADLYYTLGSDSFK
jgi:tetratricopeptide (TPR) repeat protein